MNLSCSRWSIELQSPWKDFVLQNSEITWNMLYIRITKYLLKSWESCRLILRCSFRERKKKKRKWIVSKGLQMTRFRVHVFVQSNLLHRMASWMTENALQKAIRHIVLIQYVTFKQTFSSSFPLVVCVCVCDIAIKS